MAYLLGTVVGGTIAMILIGALVGLFFKKHPPQARALRAAIGAFAIATIVAGMGMADGRGFNALAWVLYIIPTGLAFLFLRWHYGKGWVENPEADVFR